MAGILRVHRKGYHRKAFVEHRNGKRIRVKSAYVKPVTFKIKDRGKPGRGKKVIPIKKGKLAPYHTKLPAERRHAILEKKIKRYGATSVYRSLKAQVTLRKRIQPSARKVFRQDAQWIKEKYHIGKRRR